MKIGILTQPLHNNYGGILQNYALQQVLKRMGHESITLDQKPKEYPAWYVLLSRMKKSIMHLFFSSNIQRPKYVPTDLELSIIEANTRSFIDRKISRTEKCVGGDDFKKEIVERGIEALIVGSDQCWRPCYNDYLEDMFLGFAASVPLKRRVAYAVSFGVDKWEFSDEQTRLCANLANRFDLITVREKSGEGLCRDYLKVSSKQALDPTMLLTKEDYVALINECGENRFDGSVFNYILDPTPDKLNVINTVTSRLDLKAFQVLPEYNFEYLEKKQVKSDIEKCIYPSPVTWLRAFMDAKMIIVDSFHGAVFSIIFNKPFWVLANIKRGNARFESLLEMFGLEDRMISSDLLADDFDWNREIDWERVNEIWHKEAERSRSLLEEVLK